MANTTRNKASRCVMARIMRQRVTYQKNFGLGKFKTWPAAEAAAQKWLKQIKRELPPTVDPVGRMSKRNQSGIVGIFPRIDRFQSAIATTDYCRWGSRWPGCPLKGGIGFSTNRYGEDDAFALAWLAREFRTVDRDWLERKLNSFRRTKKYAEILAQKRIVFMDQ